MHEPTYCLSVLIAQLLCVEHEFTSPVHIRMHTEPAHKVFNGQFDSEAELTLVKGGCIKGIAEWQLCMTSEVTCLCQG